MANFEILQINDTTYEPESFYVQLILKAINKLLNDDED